MYVGSVLEELSLVFKEMKGNSQEFPESKATTIVVSLSACRRIKQHPGGYISLTEDDLEETIPRGISP